ncbi:MAG TPA: transcriptional repressor [Myxococcales bacterium]|nr:transcriptional repressor [Deltaproteobacteria bacterium]MBU49143.1 transcriptional repressor [Deltaproteobacteria bacterium]HAA57306.1 transcriptional repressor [Myxococcales bacterium]|tara:strand:- start:2824 stop:3204 length:381 start_codon:yes stop_codon:yes gene_type:complete
MQRKTEQRAVLKKVLKEADRPLSVQEIFEGAQSELPKIGLATVYRNIKALVEHEWLTVVDLPGESSRYEVAGKEHHHHFHCKTCDRVFEIEGCVGGSIADLTPKGFSLEFHEIILYGRCDECAESA